MTIEQIRDDARHALRTLRKSPGYALLVVATLAFGIAANTTIFSAMRPYLLRALPYGAPEELVQVNQVNPVTGWDMDRFSYPQVLDWKARTRAFRSLGAYSYGTGNLTGPEGPEQVQYSRVTSDLFGDVLRVDPLLGRGFLPEDGRPGGDPVVLLSEAFWRRRYGGDPSIVGRTVTLDGIPRTVVGIMSASFVFPFGGVRLWAPVQDDPVADRDRMNLQIVGRLEPGWTRAQARADLAAIQTELAARHPDADGRMGGVTVKPLREALNFAWDVLSISFRILLGAVVFVLLIACVNVASLTLARGRARAREVAVRAALGAPRSRVVRLLFLEGLALALAGGAVGVAMSVVATRLISPVIPDVIYRVGDIEVDGTVLLFSLVVTLATPLAFGLWPALAATRAPLTRRFGDGSRLTGGRAASRARSVLVVVQVALAVVLTSGAGLMLRSLRSVQAVDLGFDADAVVVAEVTLPAEAYPTAPERLAWLDRAVSALAGTSGVTSASASTWLPLNHETDEVPVAAGLGAVPGEAWPLAVENVTYSSYFRTMGIALLEGRGFTPTDGPDTDPVAVVSRSLAERLWPDDDAVGRTLLAGENPSRAQRYRVVGVVADVRHTDLTEGSAPLQIYRSTLQDPSRRYFLLARVEGPSAAFVGRVRQSLLSAEPDLPANVRTMASVVRENLLQWSIGSTFLGAFGAGALLLALLGIYGLIAYSVSQRRREIGVRMALGATRADVRRRVVAEGLRLTLAGVGVGLLLAMLAASAVASALYGVGPFDPLTLGAVACLFLTVAGLAALAPAVRASRTDPVGVLRSE